MAASTMQTQRISLAGQTLQTARPTSSGRVGRVAVVAHASPEDVPRRAVLGGVLAAVLAVSAPSAQAGPVDIIDGTKLRQQGYDIIYEARDLDLPQATRDGLTQFRGSLEDTKERFKEASRRINGDLGDLVQKKYWTKAREELRGQVGNIRFDVNTIGQSFDKEKRKLAYASRDKFNAAVDKLDFAIRQKIPDEAASAYAEAKSALADLTSALG
jgi:photosystem II oxygen-evolving enhancer protein 3